MALRSVAALYVMPDGPYVGLRGVDAWALPRDARLYGGPHPVVAHPPCQRWGRYWHGGPSARERRVLGDDGGCFSAALAAVRRWGGVLEHPEASHAWRHFGIARPPRPGGWVPAGDGVGSTCCVEQGHYGHRARKATWLYAVDCDLPELIWGPSAAVARLDLGFHSAEERRAFYANTSACSGDRKSELVSRWEERTGKKHFRRLSAWERTATPVPFRDVLLAMARSVMRPRGGMLFGEPGGDRPDGGRDG